MHFSIIILHKCLVYDIFIHNGINVFTYDEEEEWLFDYELKIKVVIFKLMTFC